MLRIKVEEVHGVIRESSGISDTRQNVGRLILCDWHLDYSHDGVVAYCPAVVSSCVPCASFNRQDTRCGGLAGLLRENGELGADGAWWAYLFDRCRLVMCPISVRLSRVARCLDRSSTSWYYSERRIELKQLTYVCPNSSICCGCSTRLSPSDFTATHGDQDKIRTHDDDDDNNLKMFRQI